MTLKIVAKYRRWSSPTKITIWIGIVGIAFAVFAYLFPRSTSDFKWPTSFEELKAKSQKDEVDVILERTFWLLEEPGASISLGRCPGLDCITFTLGKTEIADGIMRQNVHVAGKGFEGSLIEMGGGFITSLLRDDKTGQMIKLQFTDFSFPIRKNSQVKIYSYIGKILFEIIDTRVESLKLRLILSPPKIPANIFDSQADVDITIK